jgi:hypothetical protein
VVGATLVVALSFLLAPFMGAFFALADVWYAIFRPFNRAEGRIILDLFGLGGLVAQETARMAEEMGVESLHTAAAAPAEGGASAAVPLVGATRNPVGYGAAGAGSGSGPVWTAGAAAGAATYYAPPTATAPVVPADGDPSTAYAAGPSKLGPQ